MRCNLGSDLQSREVFLNLPNKKKGHTLTLVLPPGQLKSKDTGYINVIGKLEDLCYQGFTCTALNPIGGSLESSLSLGLVNIQVTARPLSETCIILIESHIQRKQWTSTPLFTPRQIQCTRLRLASLINSAWGLPVKTRDSYCTPPLVMLIARLGQL